MPLPHERQPLLSRRSSPSKCLYMTCICFTIFCLSYVTYMMVLVPIYVRVSQDPNNYEDAIEAQATRLQFSGVLSLMENKTLKVHTAFGLANEELHVPLTTYSTFGIASNSKLFMTVALYQLQEEGKVRLNESITHFLTRDDFNAFGYPDVTSWCPHLSEDSEHCLDVTFEHLLSMSSGIVDAFNCDNIPLHHSEECISFDSSDWSLYKGSIAPYVGMFIQSPLVFVPGSSYSYSNPNFILAAYLVEKISGLSLHTYLQIHIFRPLGLTHTSFDPLDGTISVIAEYCDSYRTFYINKAENPKPISVGSCRPYLTLGGFNGAGGIVSTTHDLMKWYYALFAEMGSSVLTPASIRAIVAPWTKVPGEKNSYYGQGIFVEYKDVKADWPDNILYCGELKCTFTCIAMTKNPLNNSTKIAAAFTNHAQIDIPKHLAETVLSGKDSIDTWISRGTITESLGGASEMRAFAMKLKFNR